MEIVWDRRWPFDVAAIVAARALGELPSDELPAAAERLILAGYATDELCSLVGLHDVDPWLADACFDRSLRALGLLMDRPTAVVVRSLDWAQRIVAGRVTPIQGAGGIGGMWRDHDDCMPDGSERDWRAFYGDWAEYDFSSPDRESRDRRVAKLDADVRERARRFVQRYGG